MSLAAEKIIRSAGGWPEVGVNEDGVVGGKAGSAPNVMAIPTASDLAQEMGTTQEEALKWLQAVGKVFQERILAGHPCGIPYVGCVRVRQQAFKGGERGLKIEQLRFSIRKLEKKLQKAGLPKKRQQQLTSLVKAHRAHIKVLETPRVVTYIDLRMPASLCAFYQKNASFYADYRDIVRETWQSLHAQRTGKRAKSRTHLRWPIPNSDNSNEQPMEVTNEHRDHRRQLIAERDERKRLRYKIA